MPSRRVINDRIASNSCFRANETNDMIEFFHSDVIHCVKTVRIRSYSGPYFPAFGLNTDQNNSEYGHFSRSDGVSLRIQSECGKIWTRITPNAPFRFSVDYDLGPY